jgi:hypothetical protein
MEVVDHERGHVDAIVAQRDGEIRARLSDIVVVPSHRRIDPPFT